MHQQHMKGLHLATPSKGAVSVHSQASRRSRVRSVNPISDVESMQSMQIIREVQLTDAGLLPDIDLKLPLGTCDLCKQTADEEVRKPAISRCNFDSGDGGFVGCKRAFCEVHGQPHYGYAHTYLRKLGDERSTNDGGTTTDRRQGNTEKIRSCMQVILQMPMFSS